MRVRGAGGPVSGTSGRGPVGPTVAGTADWIGTGALSVVPAPTKARGSKVSAPTKLAADRFCRKNRPIRNNAGTSACGSVPGRC